MSHKLVIYSLPSRHRDQLLYRNLLRLKCPITRPESQAAEWGGTLPRCNLSSHALSHMPLPITKTVPTDTVTVSTRTFHYWSLVTLLDLVIKAVMKKQGRGGRSSGYVPDLVGSSTEDTLLPLRVPGLSEFKSNENSICSQPKFFVFLTPGVVRARRQQFQVSEWSIYGNIFIYDLKPVKKIEIFIISISS